MHGIMAMIIFQVMIKISNGKNHFGKQLAASNVRLARYLNIVAIYSI